MKILRFVAPILAVIGIIASTLVASSAPLQQAFVDCQTSPCHYYLAEWTWNTDDPVQPYWVAPFVANNVGLLDLRSLPQMGTPGPVAQGWGLFVYNQAVDICPLTCSVRGVRLSSTTLRASVTNPIRSAIETRLGLVAGSLKGAGTGEVLVELFNKFADPTGQTRWKPLRGSLKDGWVLYLAGQEVQRSALDATVLSNTVAVFQADYRRNKAAGIKLESLRKWTGSEVRKLYGLGKTDAEYDELAAQILPPEYMADGQERPTTVILDNFNRADADALGTSSEGWSWTELAGDIDIVSNRAQAMNADTHNRARAEQDLSTDDHYAQAEGTSTVDGTNLVKVFVRKDSTATWTHYEGFGWWGINSAQIYKMIAGVATELGTAAQTFTASTFYTFRLTANNSDLELFVDAVSKVTVSDPAITGNLRIGIASYNSDAQWDNFEAGDLGGAARRIIITSDSRYVTPEELQWTVEVWRRNIPVEA